MKRARTRIASAFSFALFIALASPASSIAAAARAERGEEYCCCREKGMEMPEGEVCPMCDHRAGADRPAFRSCAPSGAEATVAPFDAGRLAPATQIAPLRAAEPLPPAGANAPASFARVPSVPPPRPSSR